MNHSQSEVVRKLLTDLGLGAFPTSTNPAHDSWPIYDSGIPSGPDNVIAVEDNDGYDDGRSMIDGELFYHYGLQFFVRAKDKRTGYDKMEAIRRALSGVYRVVVDLTDEAYLVHCIAHIGQVLWLGTEAPNSKRHMFSLNASVPTYDPFSGTALLADGGVGDTVLLADP